MSQITFDENKIGACIDTSTPVVYRLHHATLEDKLSLTKILCVVLHRLRKDFLAGNLGFILQELIGNANKAIIKRVYFAKSGFDISDPRGYADGMKRFAQECLDSEEVYVDELGRNNRYVEIQFLVKNGFLTILVKNSGLPTVEEMKRVQHRIDTTQGIRNTGEAFGQLQDPAEGAGLGTVMIILILRKITDNPGEVRPYSFFIDRSAEETTARINISLNTLPERLTEELSDRIVEEISSIPTYPENITKLERMLSQDDLPLSRAAAVIERDPALTTELLKVINSAQYYLPQRVKTIQNAVSLVGMRGLEALLLSFGAQKILERRYGKQVELWEHAYRCAFYAVSIAKDFDRKKLVDDVYIGGILHDIGEIIIRSIDTELAAHVTGFCRQKGIAGDVIEQLTLGYSHAKVGGHILRKWNFPEVIACAVEFSNQPRIAPGEWREVVEVVYAADQLAMIHEERIRISAIEPVVFDKFGLDSIDAIQEYGSRLNSRYQAQQESKA